MERLVSIPVSDEEYAEFCAIVERTGDNKYSLSHLAIAVFLDFIKDGGVPLIKPSTVQNATRITKLGRELPELD